MEDTRISYMTKKDVDLITEILQSQFDEFWTPSILETEILNPESTYIVAKKNEEIVGLILPDGDSFNSSIKRGYENIYYKLKKIGLRYAIF